MTDLQFLADYAQDPPLSGLVAEITEMIRAVDGPDPDPVGLSLAVLYTAGLPPYEDDLDDAIFALRAAIEDLHVGVGVDNEGSLTDRYSSARGFVEEARINLVNRADLEDAFNSYYEDAASTLEAWFPALLFPAPVTYTDFVEDAPFGMVCVAMGAVLIEALADEGE